MRIAILSAKDGWHVRDLQRAAVLLSRRAAVVDFRQIFASISTSFDSLASFDAVLVRTMPPGSLGQGGFRMDVLERLQSVLYLQKFISHPGWDLRVFVLGGRAIAGMRRHAQDGWRTNVAQGGRVDSVSLTSAEEQLALRAAAAVGAPMAGVDLLPG